MNSPRPARSSRLTPDLAFALDTLVRVVERQSREFRASILLLSDDRRHVLDAAAPSLPQAYRTAIDGLEVGPAAGSCGTAAHRESRVVVTDIERDPLWAEYRELARLYGLAACWSEPIRAPSGEMIGTFAMYYPEPRSPTPADLEVIEAAAARAGSLIEQAQHGAGLGQLVAGLV